MLIDETRAAHQELAAMMQDGRDRLLELAAQRAPQADALEQALGEADGDAVRDTFIPRLFEHFGVHIDEVDADSVLLDPEYLTTDAFPGLGDGPQAATFSRRAALAREDLALLRPDHPMVAGAIDLLLSTESGNAAFLIDGKLPPRSVLLQAVFVLECVADRAPGRRTLPAADAADVATVDTRLQPRNGFTPSAEALQRAAERKNDLGRYRKFIAQLVPPMLERAEALAAGAGRPLSAQAADAARAALDDELGRLTALQARQPGRARRGNRRLAAERDALLAALPAAAPAPGRRAPGRQPGFPRPALRRPLAAMSGSRGQALRRSSGSCDRVAKRSRSTAGRENAAWPQHRSHHGHSLGHACRRCYSEPSAFATLASHRKAA